MENPTFHLEGVVKSREETQDFEGPLSLILMLLQKNKIEIRDISISEILDQYLAYLAEMERMDLEVASEFVQMAAYLLYIKTRTLLAVEEEVTELEQLMTSLEKAPRERCARGGKVRTAHSGGVFGGGYAALDAAAGAGRALRKGI